jgi:catechol 2,3-dioxygenase-like lactoylglutathione lyase family enzyme
MSIVLNHTIVAVSDSHRGARLLADLLGLPGAEPVGPFQALRINDDLTFDFDDRRGGGPAHYAFLVDDATFDGALERGRRAGLDWGSSPGASDQKINHLRGGRGVYIRDPDGIAYEFFTADPLTGARPGQS